MLFTAVKQKDAVAKCMYTIYRNQITGKNREWVAGGPTRSREDLEAREVSE